VQKQRVVTSAKSTSSKAAIEWPARYKMCQTGKKVFQGYRCDQSCFKCTSGSCNSTICKASNRSGLGASGCWLRYLHTFKSEVFVRHLENRSLRFSCGKEVPLQDSKGMWADDLVRHQNCTITAWLQGEEIENNDDLKLASPARTPKPPPVSLLQPPAFQLGTERVRRGPSWSLPSPSLPPTTTR
jgi:hypothetical protein